MQTIEFQRPLTTVDVIIFSVRDESLQVLLVRRPAGKTEPFPESWALPGGFIDTRQDADLAACAMRKLHEKTGIDAPYLEQLGSFGNATRDPRGWSTTHVYFALIDSSGVELRVGGNAQQSQWMEVRGERVAEPLAFDHPDLLRAAVQRLRAKVEYTSLPVYLLPSEFTLSELQRIYEIVLGRTLEKKAFRTRLLAADLLDPLPRTKGGANRPAQLYRLKRRRGAHVFARPFGSAETGSSK